MTAAVESGVPRPSLFFSGVAMVVPTHFKLELQYLSIYIFIYTHKYTSGHLYVWVFPTLWTLLHAGISLNLRYSLVLVRTLVL